MSNAALRMAGEGDLNKRSFNIAMSRRTRKSTVSTTSSTDQSIDEDLNFHKSLEELLSEGKQEEHKPKEANQDQQEKVEEEKQLQLVVKHGEGVKFGGLMSRYVKVLKNNLIKARRGSRKNGIRNSLI
ncbi:hypothetical protein QJS10_CPB19g00850 [Acorus calamus]|uniref:Uncharacterized protein n=1 Tax=Acorus calamus TaxID=4465 RepID=A0AAV9CK29_ACOCL|nr:hypothetical protein QJS10_CPB19g00850 [Acorus calamus]